MKSPKMYRPFRLGDSHPLYTYPPVTDFPTWWLYANIGGMSSVVAEKDALNLTKIGSIKIRLKGVKVSVGQKTSSLFLTVSKVSHEQKILTQGGVVTQFHIIALKALFGSPSIVSSFHDDVNFLIAVLTHISTEYPAPAIAADRVSAVHRASPHVSDSICVHLWPGIWVTEEWVVRGGPVLLPTGVTSIYINAEYFSQQCTPGLGKMGFNNS